MITEEQIRTFANKLQTIEQNIRREYYQHLFLSYFYQQSGTDTIYFKGGSALRILHRSPRFSEDLDFSSQDEDVTKIEKLLVQTLSQVEKEGVNVNLEESKPTSGGYLTNIIFSASGENILIQVQISFRLRQSRGEIVTVISDFAPAYTVMSLSLDQIIDEKIQALLTRRKPRDFYDLYFLLRSNLMPAGKKDLLPKALSALRETNINFEHELKQFLPKSHWPIIRDFKRMLKNEIQRFL